MLGMALDPAFTTGPRTSTSSTRTTRAIGGTPPTWGDACPTPPGADRRRLRRQRPALAAQRPGRDRPDQGLVPAVPEPLGRRARLRRGRRPLRLAPATAPASTSPTTARTAARSTRAATRPAGSNPTPPTAEGGALRSQDSARPPTRRASTARSSASTRTRAPRCRTTRSRQLRRERPPDRRPRACATRSASRSARDERALGRRRRLEHLGGDQPRPDPARPRRELRLALLRGRGPETSYDDLNLNLCETLYAAGASAVTPPLYAYSHAAKVATETCPTGQLVDLRARVLRRRHLPERSTTARSSSPTTRATASG